MQVKNAVTGAAVGAGVAYLFDRRMGRRRRAMLRDQATHAARAGERFAKAAARDTQHRVEGAVPRMTRRMRRGRARDQVLEQRIRARIGGAVSHPSALRVEVQDRRATLRGPILAHEIGQTLRRARRTRGVREIVDHLEPHEHPGNVPALQGRGRRRRPGRRWSPAKRAVGALGGSALVAYGVTRGDARGAIAGVTGGALTLRSITNRPVPQTLGAETADLIQIDKAITIEAPLEKVFDFFSNIENFPRFLSHVREVRRVDDGWSHWTVDGPAGTSVSWDAMETAFEPNRMLAWRSEPNSMVQHNGQITFEEVEDGTRVSIHLAYTPPAGMAGHLVATATGMDPKRQLDDDLLRVKSLLAGGDVPHDARG